MFFIFYAFSGVHPQWNMFLLPAYLLESYMLSLGLAFLLCALYPRFRNVYHIWKVFVQLGFWITPIIYPAAIIPARFHKIIFTNLMARIIQSSSDAIIAGSSQFLTLNSHVIIIGANGFYLCLGQCFTNSYDAGASFGQNCRKITLNQSHMKRDMP